MPEEVEHKLSGSVDFLMRISENEEWLYLGESPLPASRSTMCDRRGVDARGTVLNMAELRKSEAERALNETMQQRACSRKPRSTETCSA